MIRISRLACLLTLAFFLPSALPAEEFDRSWPVELNADGWTVTIYQPQTEALDGNVLEGRAAVSVKRVEGSGEPLFGAIWFSAKLDIDSDERVATLRELRVPQVRFADSTAEQRAGLAELLESEIPEWEIVLDLDQLIADLDLASGDSTTPGILNDPPKFIHASEPSVLLAYDGEPRTQPIEGAAGMERVVNTPFPVVREEGRGEFYLFGGEDYWYEAPDPMGPWETTEDVPAKLREYMLQATSSEASSGSGEQEEVPPPKIVVATEPTELIVTQGEPTWTPIGDLDLLYCDNTDSDVFLELSTQRYFVLVGGRWFAGKSVNDRFEWVNVPNDELPPSFAQIPEDSVNGHVLAHVAGTEQAREEALQNTIPQTAAVRRDDDSFSVSYDGLPEFEPVKDLPEVRYAVNTASSVFVADGKYWACENAIWYMAPAATGPWSVAVSIPPSLYKVPASNPHHKVTYVHVYESTPQVVYVGYTPGYVGSYWYRGCVVWGTGWYYNPWYGPHYYPHPWSWGLSARYNPYYGWSFGVTWSNGPFSISIGRGGGYYGGWYGPGGYRPPYYRPYPPPRYVKPRPTPYRGGAAATRPGAGARPATMPSRNIYDRPATRDRVASTRPATGRARPSRLDAPNDVLTDLSGNVYRRGPDGSWESRGGGQWNPASGLDRPATPATRPGARPSQPSTRPGARPSQPSTRPGTLPQPSTRPGARPSSPAARPQLERDYRSRQRGSQRMQQRPSAAGPSPRAMPRGGGRRR